MTARSAGFNALDYAQMGTDSLFVTDMLMFIGAGSASPAGGIKVSTLAVLILIVWADSAASARRRPSTAPSRRAACVRP